MSTVCTRMRVLVTSRLKEKPVHREKWVSHLFRPPVVYLHVQGSSSFFLLKDELKMYSRTNYSMDNILFLLLQALVYSSQNIAVEVSESVIH